jgi:exopolyphosphatase/guanosine-5'-triphosphate,3'-diphosphate pyrophosphatase
MDGLSASEARIVRKASTLLRVADSLDRSHHQPVADVSARVVGGAVELTLTAGGPVDLEVWDLDHETALFRRVFGKAPKLRVVNAAGRRSRPRSRPA